MTFVFLAFQTSACSYPSHVAWVSSKRRRTILTRFCLLDSLLSSMMLQQGRPMMIDRIYHKDILSWSVDHRACLSSISCIVVLPIHRVFSHHLTFTIPQCLYIPPSAQYYCYSDAMLAASLPLIHITEFTAKIRKTTEPAVQAMLMLHQHEAFRVWRRDWIEDEGMFTAPILSNSLPEGGLSDRKKETEGERRRLFCLVLPLMFER